MPNGALVNPIVIYRALLECNVDTVAQQVLIVHVHFMNRFTAYIWDLSIIVLETIEEQKISERSSYAVKACWVTLISCSISHNFPALKRWNIKSEA